MVSRGSEVQVPEEAPLAFERVLGLCRATEKENPFYCCQDLGHVLLFSVSLLTGLTAHSAKRVFLRSLQEKTLSWRKGVLF